MPPIMNQFSTPGVSRRISLNERTTARVRTCEAASGSCTPRIAYPWSSCGMNPVGSWVNHHAVPPASATKSSIIAAVCLTSAPDHGGVGPFAAVIRTVEGATEEVASSRAKAGGRPRTEPAST